MKEIIQTLSPHVHALDAEQFSSLQTLIEGLDSNLHSVREEGRNLRIAVVGQMKSGKSSFLNAAFFGKDLLPKADTPMTAALTKIVYSAHPKAEVIFYSEEDWDGIERRAAEYPAAYAKAEQNLLDAQNANASPFAKMAVTKPTPQQIRDAVPKQITSSLELVEKARQQNLNVRAYLGKSRTLDNVSDTTQLANALQDYVGSNGQFTAITKMSVLHVDDPRLEGIELIDTPGFNDPVISRGQITRSFLGQCDVIFLLSSVSQFLTSSDMSLLREQLPEAGIDEKAIFLIGSQRDMALRQDKDIAKSAETLANRAEPEKRNAARAAAMMALLDKKLNEMASKTLDAHIQVADDKTRSILTAVRKNPLISISSWAWMISTELNQLSRDDSYQLDQLRSATQYPFQEADLQKLSNIPALREKLLSQREQKTQLLANKEQALIKGVRSGVQERLQALNTELDTRRERIRNNSIGSLEAIEKDMLKRMNGGRVKLEDVFDEQVTKTYQQFAFLKTDMRGQATRYKVSEQRETRTESYEVSTSRWYNPFSWGSSETRYREVVTIYASAQDAIDQVQDFAQKTAVSLQRAIVECVDLDSLRRKVGIAAMSLFDTGDANFDSELMMAEVNKSLRRLTIPEAVLTDKDYSQLISRSFGSGRVSESQIGGLREAQREALAAIISDLESEVDKKTSAITSSLNNTGKTFVNDMTKDIQNGLQKLREDIKNREESIQQINAAQTAVQGLLA